MRRLLSTLLCVAIAVVSCSSNGAPKPHPFPRIFPKNAVRITRVPPDYRTWWKLVEECSGRSASFDAVKWYVVLTRANEGFPWGTDVMLGLAYDDRNAIVLASASVLDSGIVMHEAGHLIASPRYHDPEIFQRRCAHLVACWRNCLSDTLPPASPIQRPTPLKPEA